MSDWVSRCSASLRATARSIRASSCGSFLGKRCPEPFENAPGRDAEAQDRGIVGRLADPDAGPRKSLEKEAGVRMPRQPEQESTPDNPEPARFQKRIEVAGRTSQKPLLRFDPALIGKRFRRRSRAPVRKPPTIRDDPGSCREIVGRYREAKPYSRQPVGLPERPQDDRGGQVAMRQGHPVFEVGEGFIDDKPALAFDSAAAACSRSAAETTRPSGLFGLTTTITSGVVDRASERVSTAAQTWPSRCQQAACSL